MRIAAIVVNLIQMIIVLFVFVLQGISMDGMTIAALFSLFLIACFNLLVLLFSGNSDHEPLVKENKGIIKRRDFRLRYPQDGQARMTIGDHRFIVLDLSEGGARIAIGRHEKLKKRFRCRIELLSGERLSPKVALLRRQGNEAALAFSTPVEFRVLLKEKQHLPEG